LKINEIRRGVSDITVEGKITDKSEPRRVNTRYGPRFVCDSTIEDETGAIQLSLWEENIEKVNIGDTVKANGAYVTEYRNQLQLNIPRSGKIEITKENIIELRAEDKSSADKLQSRL
jgi:replication factor A1